jgi:hypothetical protein
MSGLRGDWQPAALVIGKSWRMTGNDNSAGQSGIVATCGKPARAFRELGWCEAAELPKRGPARQDAGRVP